MNSMNKMVMSNGTIYSNLRHKIEYINKLADCSLFAFMKIFAKINREPKILEYRLDERLS